jgi:hypothetical protein
MEDLMFLSPRLKTALIALAAAGVAVLVMTPRPALSAGASSPTSVGKVLELYDTLDTDPEAPELLFAYLSGVGETAGALITAARAQGGFAACGKSLTLDGDTVYAALRGAGGALDRAATPIIVEDMLARAECR